MFNLTNKKIYLAGHTGMLGSALERKFRDLSYSFFSSERENLDLRNQKMVDDFIRSERPEVIFLAAALVGGINANRSRPAEFLSDNLIIQHNIMNSALKHGVDKLVFYASSCSYPVNATQPLNVNSLMTGLPESTNQWYSVAKIAGIKMIESFNQQYGTEYISIIPTNAYGPGDNFDKNNSHVIPALIAKMHNAKIYQKKNIDLWGTGKPLREFIYIDDLAEASIFLVENYFKNTPINVGTGKEISIKELASIVSEITGYEGSISFDESMPDGAMKKALDSSEILSMGWKPRVKLKQGIKEVYNNHFLNFYA